MQVRLAFSIAIQAQADILLIDEVLAVGDSAFQKKCFDVFKRLKKEGRTIVFVTHDMTNVQDFCDRVLVIHNSKVLAITGPDQAADLYNQLNTKEALEEINKPSSDKRWGTGDVRVKTVEFMDIKGNESTYFKTGEPFKIKIILEDTGKRKEAGDVQVGLAFYESDGSHIAGPNSGDHKIHSKANHITYTLSKLPFVEGNYAVTVAVYSGSGKKTYDFIDKGFSFSVSGNKRSFGITTLFGEWESK
jgi:ABC-type methionine transport system ATPase subunit